MYCGWPCKFRHPFWKRVWSFLKNQKVELLSDPPFPLLGTYPKKMKILIVKDTCTPTFIAALFTIAKIQKQSKCPTTKKEILAYILYIYNIHIYIYTPCVYIHLYISIHTHMCTYIHIYIYIYIHTHTHIYTHTHHGVLFSHEKEWNLAICDNIVGSQKHYEK